ncbi:hypothetical protein EON64_05285 [archaeon]|nr:MAG: hypothetical protein EON64_05285 [archaeon]
MKVSQACLLSSKMETADLPPQICQQNSCLLSRSDSFGALLRNHSIDLLIPCLDEDVRQLSGKRLQCKR